MTRGEFLDRVLAPLGRLTAEEREEVRRELEEHVEDRMEAMLDMGWDEELAEGRCLEAMGDPAEIGREMAKQYRGRGWLWLGRAAVLLTAVLCVQAVWGLLRSNLKDGLEARWWPERVFSGGLEDPAAEALVDIRAEIGNDVLRVFRVSVGTERGERVAEVCVCAYDRLPWGIPADNLSQRGLLTYEGGAKTPLSGGGWGRYHVNYNRAHIPVSPEDTMVVLEYRRFGERVRLEIPLPEREAAS